MPASPSPAVTATVTSRVLPLRPSRRRPVDRDAALRQVRSVRHHVQSRDERFAHLKRVYD